MEASDASHMIELVSRRLGLGVGIVLISIGSMMFVLHLFSFSLSGITDISVIKGPTRDLSIGLFAGAAILSTGIATIVSFRKRKVYIIPADQTMNYPVPVNPPKHVSQHNMKIERLEHENLQLKDKLRRLLGQNSSHLPLPMINCASIATCDGNGAVIAISYSTPARVRANQLQRGVTDSDSYESSSDSSSTHSEVIETVTLQNKLTLQIESKFGRMHAKSISGGNFDFHSGLNSGYMLDIRVEYDDGYCLRKCVEIARKMGFGCHVGNQSASCFLERGVPKVEEQFQLLPDICNRIVGILNNAQFRKDQSS